MVNEMEKVVQGYQEDEGVTLSSSRRNYPGDSLSWTSTNLDLETTKINIHYSKNTVFADDQIALKIVEMK